MKKAVQWSPRALSEYDHLLAYLLEEWGKRVTLNFIGRLEKVIEMISQRPTLYPASNSRKHVRRWS